MVPWASNRSTKRPTWVLTRYLRYGTLTRLPVRSVTSTVPWSAGPVAVDALMDAQTGPVGRGNAAASLGLAMGPGCRGAGPVRAP